MFQQHCELSENIIYIIEDPNIIESNLFKSFLSVFNSKSHHLLYCEKYRDTQEYIPQLTRHYKLTNQLSQSFPKHIPPIESIAQSNILDSFKSYKVIQDLFPDKSIEMYKRYYELVITPRSSKSYTYFKSPLAEE